jgi:hypothetical protein
VSSSRFQSLTAHPVRWPRCSPTRTCSTARSCSSLSSTEWVVDYRLRVADEERLAVIRQVHATSTSTSSAEVNTAVLVDYIGEERRGRPQDLVRPPQLDRPTETRAVDQTHHPPAMTRSHHPTYQASHHPPGRLHRHRPPAARVAVDTDHVEPIQADQKVTVGAEDVVMAAAHGAARRLAQTQSRSSLEQNLDTPDPEGPDPLPHQPQPHRRVPLAPPQVRRAHKGVP